MWSTIFGIPPNFGILSLNMTSSVIWWDCLLHTDDSLQYPDYCNVCLKLCRENWNQFYKIEITFTFACINFSFFDDLNIEMNKLKVTVFMDITKS